MGLCPGYIAQENGHICPKWSQPQWGNITIKIFPCGRGDIVAMWFARYQGDKYCTWRA